MLSAAVTWLEMVGGSVGFVNAFSTPSRPMSRVNDELHRGWKSNTNTFVSSRVAIPSLFLTRRDLEEENNDDHTSTYSSTHDHSKRRLLQKIAVGTLGLTAGLSPPYTQNACAMYTDPKSKIVLPSEGEVERCIPAPSSTPWVDEDNPFMDLDKSSFARLDETPDTKFYTDPRFTEHVDDNAVQLMTKFIKEDVLKEKDAVLDLCSSWTSHISQDTAKEYQLTRIAGLGMNEQELKSNPILSDYVVQDLNTSPELKLPYEDSSFNVVLCQLSIDYLIHPLNVMKEIGRVLKPGGKVVILFSNRLFLSKAVGLWTGKDDLDHVYTVASYLNFCDGGFANIVAKDLSKRDKKKGRGGERMIIGDPMYAVIGEKALG